VALGGLRSSFGTADDSAHARMPQLRHLTPAIPPAPALTGA
jgi:hypothetical protein